MESKRLLDYDKAAGIATYHHYDDSTNITTIETVQDVQPYLELNKRMANDNDIKSLALKHNFVRVGSIPVTVQYQWAKDYGIKNIFAPEYHKKVMSLLRSPEWKYLRSVTGKI